MISSPDNPKLKHIKKCNAYSKTRKSHNQTVLESPNLIKELLTTAPEKIDYIICTEEHTDIIELAKVKHTALFTCEPQLFTSFSYVKTPPGCSAVVNVPSWRLPATLPKKALALTGIQKPANLGAILRNAHAFNCPIIYICEPHCDPFHPESIRASAGNIWHVPLIFMNQSEFFKILAHYECWQCSAQASTSIHDIPKQENQCFVFGSESGFPHTFPSLNSCKIPMNQQVESLNISVSTGIILQKLFTKKNF